MNLTLELPGDFLPETVTRAVIDNVSEALNSITTIDKKFVVNDSLYFRKQRTKKITPCVMNSANFISKSFQANLAKIDNCSGETKIGGQAFDGLIKVACEGVGYKIKDPNQLLFIIHKYIELNNLPSKAVYTLFPMFYGMYVERGYYDIEPLTFAREYFVQEDINVEFRVGVEFETGNVASSFRAINKLYTLFQENIIDAGCFITSQDKANCATRIWPVSNRNGSFQELEQRNYKDQISLPMVAVGFSPDGFSCDAPFLSRRDGTYYPEETGQVDESGKYKILIGEDGEEVLLPNY